LAPAGVSLAGKDIGQASMTTRRTFMAITGAAALAGCVRDDGMSRVYAGPDVTAVEVHKSRRELLLLHHDAVLKAYEIDLGFTPQGRKRFEGDGRTPEGKYYINRRNPESEFYLSLGISYPNRRDVAYALSRGREPGGDIFIHGQVPTIVRRTLSRDWTAGCIAVSNSEMREIYWMVRVGTPITLYA
jgi:murein L,D-transpeptidase YafK